MASDEVSKSVQKQRLAQPIPAVPVRGGWVRVDYAAFLVDGQTMAWGSYAAR